MKIAAGPPYPLYQGLCAYDDWSPWYDIDDPSGEGDYETLASIIERYPHYLCLNPTEIEGRLAGTTIDATSIDQDITLDPSEGLICKNIDQACQNYEVRFCCPKSKFSAVGF